MGFVSTKLSQKLLRTVVLSVFIFSSLPSKTEFIILLRKRYFIVFNLAHMYAHTHVSNGEGVEVGGKFEEVGFSFH